MDILIFYEHKEREINNACLLKNELERRGFSVKIASLYNITTSYLIQPFYFTKPKVVVMPWLYGSEEVEKVKNLFKNAKFNLVNLQCEQVTSKKWIDVGYFFPKGKAKEFLHICWGKKIFDRLVEHGINRQNLLLSGALSTDFDRYDFLNIMISRDSLSKKYSLDVNKKWNLFISSFTYTTLSNEEIEELYKRTNAEEDGFLEIMINSKDTIVHWIIEFVKSHPNNEFIYRPHPGERADIKLLELEKEYYNFHVIGDMSVAQWIYVCDIINSWFSTSVADAYFLGKNFSVLRPTKIPLELDSELLIDLSFITNEEDFQIFNEGKQFRELTEFNERIKLYYDYDENIYAYQNICDQIDYILNTDNSDYVLQAKSNNKIKYFRSLLSYLTYYIRVSKVVPFKNDVFREFEKENYLVNQYIKRYSAKLRGRYES